MSQSTNYDAVVIGGGIGGLTTAAFLCKSGFKVLVVEKHHRVGGYCTSFRRKGYSFDSSVHHIGSCGKWGIVAQAFRELGIEGVPFTKITPLDYLHFPDFSYEIPDDMDTFEERLSIEYPEEKEGLKKFFNEVGHIYRSVVWDKENRREDTWKNATYQGLLDSYLSCPKLKQILSGEWGYVGLPPDKAGAVGTALILGCYWKDGAYYPLDGMQSVADALSYNIEKSGGEITLSAEAEEILIEDKDKSPHVAGARLSGGEGTVKSDVVVSAIDPLTTFTKMIPSGTLPSSYIESLHNMTLSASFFSLWLGLSSKVDLTPIKHGFYHLPDNKWLYITVPTRFSSNIAPKSKQILSVLAFSGEGSYNISKDKVADDTIAYLLSFIPTLKENIEVIEKASPSTYQHYTANSQGAAYGWALTPGQSGRERLSQNTPISGLYLAGHWSYPGPGIPAVIASGWRAAKLVIKS